MEQKDILKWSDVLNEARVHATPVAQLSNQIEGWGRSEPYAIQEKGIEFRVAQGERLVGFKMGLTSEAKRKQMNLELSAVRGFDGSDGSSGRIFPFGEYPSQN